MSENENHSTDSTTSNGNWDKLKHTPTTIVVDGLSINDYLSTIRDQVNLLRDQIRQQNNGINELKKELETERIKNKELSEKNGHLLDRIVALEQRPDPATILSTLSRHEEEIKDLTSRPIVDLGESIRLSVVEKKLASFYGDDINILGRVAHLENLRAMDKEVSDDLAKSQNKINTILDHHQNDLALQKDLVEAVSKELKHLQNNNIDDSKLGPILQKHLKQFPTSSDFNEIKNLINRLANDNRDEFARIRQEDLSQLNERVQDHDAQLQQLQNKNHEPSVMCFGTDQSARISSLEARQISLELLPQSLEDLRQRLLALEDQSRQVMKTALVEASERNKLGNICNKLENSQSKYSKLLEDLKNDISSLSSEMKQQNDYNSRKMDTKASINDVEAMIREKFEKNLKQSNEEDNEKNIELLKEFCKELEKRVFILANECRDGLEFVQSSQDKKIEILTKWILKNLNGRIVEKSDKGDGTDIGVKCLACNNPSSHVNPKTTVGGGFSFGASERFGGERANGHLSPPKTPAPFRVTVPESLRSLISKSREGTNDHPNNPHDDFSSTQRLFEDGDHVSYDDIQPKEKDSGKVEGSQPHWNNSRYRGFPSRPSSANNRRTKR